MRCEAHYLFQEPVRASPLPVRPDPHLPQGCNVRDLHNETVLLASLEPGGIERPRRFPTALQHPCISIPSPCCNPHLANSLELKVYERTLLDLSFSVLQSPATVFLARNPSADLTGIPPPLENQAHTGHLESFQAACSIRYHSVTRTVETRSQVCAHRLPAGICPRACPWPVPTRRQSNLA